MVKKIILLMFLFLISIMSINAQGCYFKSFDLTCERISTSFNTFTIDGANLSQNFNVEIFNTRNPQNTFQFVVNDFNINQITPFLEPGVYAIKIDAYDSAGNIKVKEFEYVFDNIEPMPPIIPFELVTSSSQITVEGEANPMLTLKAFANGNEYSAIANQDGAFSIVMNLNLGINYVKFWTVKDNGLKSQIVERIIYRGENLEKNLQTIDLITFDNLENINDRTIQGMTTKRNFYVQGNVNPQLAGIEVYVNGIKTLTDQNGRFGAFVLLNEGDNEIIAKSGSVIKVENMLYAKLRFAFLELNYDKVIKDNSLHMTGKVNINYPFLVFVNGKYQAKINPENENFDFTATGFKHGKNFIELRGINNQIIRDIIYYDVTSPQINLISSPDLSRASEMVFEIKDDIGINLNSINLQINNQILDKEKMRVMGNYYIFDISHLVFGDYGYNLYLKDLADKEKSKSGQIKISKENTLIDKIFLDGTVIGNNIFLKNGNVQLNMIPSRNVAFKSIFLDGVEQTDYKISRDNTIHLNINISNQNGTIDFKFINNNYDEFTSTFNYFSNLKKPQLVLDYIEKPYTKDIVKLSGKIDDDYFDWNSLLINNQKTFTRYGNYFEAIIEVSSGKSNLVVAGYDFAGNSFSKTFGSILFKDSSKSEINLDIDENLNYIGGTLSNHEEHFGNYNFMSSYDGFDFNKVYLSADHFKLPVAQRSGLRSLNLEGFESSNMRFNSNEIISFGNTSMEFSNQMIAPQIFFSGNDMYTNNANHFVQGNLISNSEIVSVSLSNGQLCQFDDISFVCEVALVPGENVIEVVVIDANGLEIRKEIIVNYINTELFVNLNKIYGDSVYEMPDHLYLLSSLFNIDGDVNKNALIKVLIDGQEFFTKNQNGSFILPINIEEQIKSIESKNISVQLVAEDEYGNRGISNAIILIYKRVFETIAKVIVK